ncbi:DUF3310 domain-containing protein [Propionibacterium freudenreichii]|uniref:DUF3310 domain-containing protein n=1 Tax=Propionibacterium freudenreichii TaxID=1744 RepID=UPI0021A8F5C5|nr:DUF3310 domain-containing protein [Propionibacterium freudenreichii]
MSAPVNNPSHYTCFGGHEVIDIIEHLDFCRGSAVAIPRTLATTTKDPAITAWAQSNINRTEN